jgi:hypothetical protein
MLDHIKHLIALDNICYPELLGKMFIINAPWVATSVWMMIRSWLDPRTQDKIELLGSGPKMHARLLEFISPENLPTKYGGTAPDLYPQAEHMEYVSVPANGRHAYSIFVPAGRVLKVDTYASDGAFDVTVNYNPNNSMSTNEKSTPTTAAAAVPVHNAKVNVGATTTSTGASKQTELAEGAKIVLSYVAEKAEGSCTDPVRTMKRVHSAKEDRYYTVSWGNRCSKAARHVVFVLTVE